MRFSGPTRLVDYLGAEDNIYVRAVTRKRRMNFPKRQWSRTIYDGYSLTYKGESVFINRSQYNQNHYGVSHKGVSIWRYKGRAINNFISAAYAAFDLADPVEDCSL